DPWSHFVNVFMLDREGNRIDRRNPQDIFVPLYNHQIPPGAAQVVHYGLELPERLDGPVTIEARLQYRKFDKRYMDFVTTKSAKPGDNPIRGYTPGQPYRDELPVTTLAVDRITLGVEGVREAPVDQPSPVADPAQTWQRWNDYGIGLLLEGENSGLKGELRQSAEAFAEVEKLGRYDGPLNLARVYDKEGRVDEAGDALVRAEKHSQPSAPPWTLAWLSGRINWQQGRLAKAKENLRSVLEYRTAETADRGFDFSLDYEVINLYGQTLWDLAKQAKGPDRADERRRYFERAIEQFQKTLRLDSENFTAHYSLASIFELLGDKEKAAEHRRLHERFKADDNAGDRAIKLARQKYPAANHAAEAVVIYSLHRPGAPGLPAANDEIQAGGGQ
ncbi:MAG TPA: tetratricopeptide repeat protein, partial [Pirellulales bacterium]|nr:tetratricopeptide repeat protein [Pirellulales bacterium]